MKYFKVVWILLSSLLLIACSADPDTTSSSAANITPSSSTTGAAAENDEDPSSLLALGDFSPAPSVLTDFPAMGTNAPELKAIDASLLADRVNVKFICTDPKGFVGNTKSSLVCGRIPLNEVKLGLVEQSDLLSTVNATILAQIFEPNESYNGKFATDCGKFCPGNLRPISDYPNLIGKQGRLVVGFLGQINPSKLYMLAVEYRGAYKFGYLRFSSIPLQTMFTKSALRVPTDSTGTSIFSGKKLLGVTAAGHNALFTTGEDDNYGRTTYAVSVYDTLKGTWAKAQKTIDPPQLIFTLDKSAVFIGYAGNYQIFDSEANSWSGQSYVETLMQQNHFYSPAIIDGRAYFGGLSNPFVASVDKSRLLKFHRTKYEQLKQKDDSQSISIAVDGNIYLFPTYPSYNSNGSNCTTAMKIITARNDQVSYETIPGVVNYCRGDFLATAIGKKLYITGWKNDSHEISKTIAVYDIVAKKWSEMTMPRQRSEIGSMFSFGNYLFITGGKAGACDSCEGNPGSNGEGSVDIFDTTSGRWTFDSMSRLEKAAAVGNKIIFYSQYFSPDLSVIYEKKK